MRAASETDLGLMFQPTEPYNAFYNNGAIPFLTRSLLIQSIAQNDIQRILDGDAAVLHSYVRPTGPDRIGYTLRNGVRAVVLGGTNELYPGRTENTAEYFGFRQIISDAMNSSFRMQQ